MFFKNSYKNKVVLVTGHTGFKGTWLVVWLKILGAKVIGISKGLPTEPSAFSLMKLSKDIQDYRFDIKNLDKIKAVIAKHKPDFIFHLAAQAIVSTSYKDPIDTIQTNAIGTMNILEAIKDYKKKCSVVMITSDKCYENVEWVWGYKETDQLGGKDIYSASKAAAEIIIHGYYHSFVKNNSNISLGIARAGNVIGGGDWAKDRLIVDSVSSWMQQSKVTIRSPKSTRPWQHVLEPLSGYLLLGSNLSDSKFLNGEAFNFGPQSEQNRTVKEVIEELARLWGFKKPSDAIIFAKSPKFKEAALLKLNCDKASFYLNWEPTLAFSETMEMVADWYKDYQANKSNVLNITSAQIISYQESALRQRKIWTS
tara:strand:+ start:501 stop:1601 length:1101 start_codon:yes stop_codon:yes gene_type:complete